MGQGKGILLLQMQDKEEQPNWGAMGGPGVLIGELRYGSLPISHRLMHLPNQHWANFCMGAIIWKRFQSTVLRKSLVGLEPNLNWRKIITKFLLECKVTKQK